MEARILERKCSDEHPLDQRKFRAATIESVREVVEAIGLVSNWPPPAGSDARTLIALLAFRHTQATRAEIGRLLGVTGRGALFLIRRGEERVNQDPLFAALVLEGQSRLT